MNTEPKNMLSIAITGVLTIERRELEQLVVRFAPVNPAAGAKSPKMPESDGKPVRLSYSVKQTAELLGVATATVYRLLARGLLRSSSALRTKIIPKTEIERFLKETTRSS
ncbi:MAG TPA: helix-turn-helix domain-containing protein [Verrucomicrobiae bacterium]|jgi:excisionase family DNA binding protein